MQALKLRSAYGWLWIRAGWRILRGQPFRFVLLLLVCWMLVAFGLQLAGQIGLVLGSPLVAGLLQVAVVVVLEPGLTAGYMQACRDASTANGAPANLKQLIAPFREGTSVVRQLVWIGVIKFLLISAFTAVLPKGDPPVAAPTPASSSAPASSDAKPTTTTPTTQANPTQASQADIEQAAATLRRNAPLALVWLLIELLVWYAPVLVVWHRLSAIKAVFFSAVAVWRNLGAFLVFGLGWFVFLFALIIPANIATAIAGAAGAVILVPLMLFYMTWIACSKYPSYESVFVVSDRGTPAPPPDVA